MKLHNLLLTAALFVSASIASAVEEPESYLSFQTGTNTVNHNTYTTYYLTPAAGSNTLDVTLLQYAGNANKEKGWTYYAIGYKTDGTTAWEKALTLENARKEGSGITGGGITLTAEQQAFAESIGTPEDGDSIKAYMFTVTYDNEVTASIAFEGRNGDAKKLVSSFVNTAATNDFHFSDIENTDSILLFGKNEFTGTDVKGMISTNGIPEASVVGSPLPAPLVTLLIALGFGAALVMYRNRKQVNA